MCSWPMASIRDNERLRRVNRDLTISASKPYFKVFLILEEIKTKTKQYSSSTFECLFLVELEKHMLNAIFQTSKQVGFKEQNTSIIHK